MSPNAPEACGGSRDGLTWGGQTGAHGPGRDRDDDEDEGGPVADHVRRAVSVVVCALVLLVAPQVAHAAFSGRAARP